MKAHRSKASSRRAEGTPAKSHEETTAQQGTSVGFGGRRMELTSCLKDVVRPTCTRRVRQMAFCVPESTGTSTWSWSSNFRHSSHGPVASTSDHRSECFVAP